MNKATEEQTVEIFTDGGCWDNPGPGGWGVVLRSQGKEKKLSGHEPYTTNNRMELQAAIEGLIALKRKCKVKITTDSKYLKDGILKWIVNWKKNGWKTANKTNVKNIDLWRRLDQLMRKHDIDWHWVRGHTGHRENEMADQLAQDAIKKFLKSLKSYD